MEAFLKMKWPNRDMELKEKAISTFIPDELVDDLYLAKHLKSPMNFNSNSNHEIQTKYCPGLDYQFLHTIKSNLDKWQQMQCLKALMIYQTEKQNLTKEDKQLLDTYNNLKPLIYEENEKFQQTVKKHWTNRKSNPFLIGKPQLRLFSVSCMKGKLPNVRNYPKLYKHKSMVSISYGANDEKLEMVQVQNLLEMGDIGKFQIPSLKSKFEFKIGSLPEVPKMVKLNSKLPVSKDKNIDNIVENFNTNIVISSSGLKRLIDFTDLNDIWNIPVVVKQVNFKRADNVIEKRNIVFIDKPCPRTTTIMSLNEKGHKMLLKTNFCQFEAFSYDLVENEIENSLVQSIDLIEKLEHDILGENKAEIPKTEESNEVENTIHHNVSYRLWELKQKFEDNKDLMKRTASIRPISVLVRTKLDGCEQTDNGTIRPVIVVPKLEYQLEYGARIPSKSELAKQWASVFFRPYSALYRVLIHAYTSEIITVQSCDATKIINEACTYYNYNPNYGLGVLYKVFSSLMSLTPGNYLLHHTPEHGPFIDLMDTTETMRKGVYNLHNYYKKFKTKPISEKERPWWPIDTNFVLPAHIELQQMPGLFKGFRYDANFRKELKEKNKKKGKVKKKSNKKRKKQQQKQEVDDQSPSIKEVEERQTKKLKA